MGTKKAEFQCSLQLLAGAYETTPWDHLAQRWPLYLP
jgi:hypothetical protein